MPKQRKSKPARSRSEDERSVVPNVLATRYASPAMRAIWSPEQKIVMERRLWVEVLRAQQEFGVPVPDGAVEDYEAVIETIDLDSIEARERFTRHDVKARIEEFCALAGHEHIHLAMTSRDVTENIEQAQMRASLVLVRDRLVAVLARLCALADQYRDLAMAGRTHNVAAQVTTLGKRWATIGTEVLDAISRLEDLLERLPLRGIKGPVGTQQDMADLFAGNAASEAAATEAVAKLEQRIAEHLGFSKLITSVGQVYPRSHDLDFVACLSLAAAPLGNAAVMVRLMAGNELVTEGFKDDQVGSSAMPHKMNTRSSERVSGLLMVLRGHLAMVAQLAGDQWLEGDVSCSVVRRVVLPDACFAIDGAIETTLEVLDGFAAFDVVITAELNDYLPFLATTRLLNAAVAAGCGREQAHELIREHAIAAALQRRTEGRIGQASDAGGGDVAPSLAQRIVADEKLGLTADDVAAIMTDAGSFTGLAGQQVDEFIANAAPVLGAHQDAATYQPNPTL